MRTVSIKEIAGYSLVGVSAVVEIGAIAAAVYFGHDHGVAADERQAMQANRQPVSTELIRRINNDEAMEIGGTLAAAFGAFVACGMIGEGLELADNGHNERLISSNAPVAK